MKKENLMHGIIERELNYTGRGYSQAVVEEIARRITNLSEKDFRLAVVDTYWKIMEEKVNIEEKRFARNKAIQEKITMKNKAIIEEKIIMIEKIAEEEGISMREFAKRLALEIAEFIDCGKSKVIYKFGQKFEIFSYANYIAFSINDSEQIDEF